MKRVIVTGGNGFVGSAVIEELLANHTEVYAVVRPGFSSCLEHSRLYGKKVHLVECDIKQIRDLPDKMQERGFDAWYQFAWDGLRGEALTDYTTQIMNVKWVMDAILCASAMECRKFIGSGSVSQYELNTPEGRANALDKHKVYKTAKLCCEYMGSSVAADNGIEFIWPIITNIYGVGETSPRLINSMIRNLQAGKHQPLSDGNQMYDFIYISDAAKAFRRIGENGRSNRSYIIAQGKVRPLKEFLTILRDIVSPEATLGFGEMQFNGVYLPASCYDISALVDDTGFQAEVTFEEGIRRTAQWLLDKHIEN
ncbi:MAG: NAD(P)-dependent oxidoreductase [Agathobaculum sp.]|uniref:NAD-dependent epimerase/dehydratase family protein n=1 Tax=Agathobaculum sp. TaxID=2048138 RepID=UPI0025C3DC0B|nr:NAD(P)-dependent oxidoreductase [Agathobaculum sp.]MCI7126437.1 NAD(P)-dependent oxidoreductase [Agathobaculum sp.]MDY3712394.1 NAD(P)-dependent oxidoreductase [Agathobaculum sp.]